MSLLISTGPFPPSFLVFAKTMFLTVFGQKGGVAKTCTSIHLASVWAHQGFAVCVVDADRNRSATAYAARGMLPFDVVPVEAAAKATRTAQVIITDGQASSNDDELRNLSAGADLVLLPTTPQARSVELTIELSATLRSAGIAHAALLVKVDSRKQRCAWMPARRWKVSTSTCSVRRSPCWRLLTRRKWRESACRTPTIAAALICAAWPDGLSLHQRNRSVPWQLHHRKPSAPEIPANERALTSRPWSSGSNPARSSKRWRRPASC